MKWRVDIEDKHGNVRTEALCMSWWSAHRLVVGITGFIYDDVANQATQFEQEFTVPWYKETIYVKKHESEPAYIPDDEGNDPVRYGLW